jgi:hypothetical protein
MSHILQARFLPTLLQKAQALEVYAPSKVWQAGQILPLPRYLLVHLQKADGEFLWQDLQ